MAKDELNATDMNGTNKKQPTTGFGIIAQYVKDLSFENPEAPHIFTITEKPKIDLGVNVKAQKAGENSYEVDLLMTVKATTPEKTVFIAELTYTGLFSIPSELEEARLEPLLLIEAPFLLYPYARRIIADATRDGGFPPLMLEPINFAAMYMEKKNSTKAA